MLSRRQLMECFAMKCFALALLVSASATLHASSATAACASAALCDEFTFEEYCEECAGGWCESLGPCVHSPPLDCQRECRCYCPA
jgi:hypothetical protein